MDKFADNTTREKAIAENYAAFKELLPELMTKWPGKFAVLRERQVMEVFDSVRDAMIFGARVYPDGLFSVQEIVDRRVDLGFFSHAMHLRHV